jgi:hypothetical protein
MPVPLAAAQASVERHGRPCAERRWPGGGSPERGMAAMRDAEQGNGGAPRAGYGGRRDRR